jgi:hypothetical protein
MGWLSSLAKVGLAAAAPFTGGASLMAMPATSLLDKIGSQAGGAAAGSQAGRLAQDQANARIYDSQVQGALGLGQLDMARQKFAAQLPGMQTANIARASLLQNIGDLSLGGPGNWKVSGGIRPSALGQDAKLAAAIMAQKQMQALQQGPQFEKIQMPTAPQQSKAGWLEKILGGIGTFAPMAGSILGGLNLGGGGGGTSSGGGGGFDSGF